MNENIKVSIITASYNYAEYISEAIESVINQTYPNWELIIVDDGSKDNSVEIIKSYCDKDNRIKLVQHKNGKNKGLKQTLLLGLKKASADWIAFLEADDYYAPNNLEEKISIINQRKDIFFIFNNYEIIGNKTFLDSPYYNISQKMLNTRNGNYSYKDVCCKYNPVATFSMVLLHKSVLKSIDFNTSIHPWLDYYLWLQVAKKHQFYYLNKKLTFWRKHQNSYINTLKTKNFLLWKLKLCILCPYYLKYMIKRTLFVISEFYY